ncbi:hypothetical protein JFU49_21785 [Pseudomonas sp. TH03]|uniref:hypothetical protein n=1 Tax=Pseudomonas sp. TH03 TaxID=2796369 RepID=UPI001911B24B|nr:hypothetical protein [Pseudomonas sp. TH03]MBK5552888.1 hypothetical protein [Pseudomonas sp. TH03]
MDEYFVLNSIVLEQETFRNVSAANGGIDQAFQLDHKLAGAAPDTHEAVHSSIESFNGQSLARTV